MNDIEVSSIDLVEGGNVFKQGHYLTLGYVPRDEKGETVDLSGKTLNVSLWGRKGVVFEAAATYSGGVIRFTFDKLVAAGDYTVEFTATSSTDEKYRKKFPTNQHSGRIAIKQSADDLGVVGIQVYTVAQLKAEQKALLDAAVSGFTVDSETKMARVSGSTTYTSLPARLEADKQATAAQLADKAQKSEVRVNTATKPINVSEMDTETKALFTGGSVAVVGENAVGSENVKPKAILPSKTTFAEKVIVSKNLYNPNTLSTGTILADVTGALAVNSGYNTTDFIDVKPSTRYRTSNNGRLVEYDESGNFIKLISSTSDFTTSATTGIIRISFVSTIPVNSIVISEGVLATDTYKEMTRIKDFEVSNVMVEDIKNRSSLQATNLATNGNFVDGTGWTFFAGLGYQIADNTLTINTLTSSAAEVYRTFPTAVGHKYYVSELMKGASSADSLYIATPLTNVNPSGRDEDFERLSTVVEASTPSIAVRLLNSGRAGDTSSRPIKIKNVLFVDLTENFGAGKEPSKAEFEELLDLNGGWFDGTQVLLDEKILLNRINEVTENNNTDVRWIATGDSITEGALEYPDRANEKLKFTMTNSGYGGSSMAMRSNENISFNPESFVYKAKNTIDWTLYDVVTIFYGTNDWSNDVPIGTINDSDEYTYMGALNVGLQAIYTQNPTIKVVLVTPLFRRNTLANVNALDLKLADYVAAVKLIREKYRTKLIDLWLNSGWNYYTCESYTTDGLHPNAAGQIVLGNIFADELAFMKK